MILSLIWQFYTKKLSSELSLWNTKLCGQFQTETLCALAPEVKLEMLTILLHKHVITPTLKRKELLELMFI